MSGEQLQPVGEVLGDLRVEGFADGHTSLAAFILVKTRGVDGDETWNFRTTPGMNLEELYGAMQIQVELLRRSLLDAWSVD